MPTDFPAHLTFLGPSGKYGLELMANLERCAARRRNAAIVGAPKHQGGSWWACASVCRLVNERTWIFGPPVDGGVSRGVAVGWTATATNGDG